VARRLDFTVWFAYGWEDDDPAEVAADEILARLLALNLERSGAVTSRHGPGAAASAPRNGL